MKRHLFCNPDREFFAKLKQLGKTFAGRGNERGRIRVLVEKSRPTRLGLCIPYELGGLKPFYPDFIIVRKEGSAFVVDVLEPHDSTRSDAWAKAKGLADFADKHGLEFGRLIFARKQGDVFQRVDMNDKTTRRKARAMESQSDLEALFG